MRAIILAALLPIATPALAQDAARGADLFQAYCATCHGPEGRGDGPMMPALNLMPPDLTGIAREEGQFPVEWMVVRIDGRNEILAHGGPMPVWGDFFEGGKDVAIPTETGQLIMTSQPIADLVTWLAGIQE